MSLTYLESSVLVGWILDSDTHRLKTDALINEINNNMVVAITSTLAIMETIDVIRKRITESNIDTVSTKVQINETIMKLLNGLTSLAAQSKLLWDDPQKSLGEVFEEALKILKFTFGDIQTITRCKRCRQPLSSTMNVYKGAGHYDVQHAIIAREINANHLITYDRDFEELSHHPNLSKMRFDVR